MMGWLSLSIRQRRATLEQAAHASGISVKAIEKDWWVTFVLRALFEGPYGQYMIFKGGTSLSKCWQLIERFSEDIDIALDAAAFGMEYKIQPSKNNIEQLKRKGCAFISDSLRGAISWKLMEMGVPSGMIVITAEEVDAHMPDKDPQVLIVTYPSVYDVNAYIKEEVRVEVSVRSPREPFSKRPIQSLLYTWFPRVAYIESPATVAVMDPKRTCLEKAFLLHEEFMKPDETRIRIRRMSRHFYDLYQLDKFGVADGALRDRDLYTAIVKHRKSYSRLRHVRYETLAHHSISFLPPSKLWPDYKNDYLLMQEQMIYGETVPFDGLMHGLDVLLGKFRINTYHH